MSIRNILVLILLVVTAWGACQVSLWNMPRQRRNFSKTQKRLRSIGLICLLGCLSLAIYGTFIPTPVVTAHKPNHSETMAIIRYFAYWSVTTLLIIPLIPLAILDSRDNLRQLALDAQELAEERRRLLALQNRKPSDTDSRNQ